MIFLVVDDEPDMLEFLADAIEVCGFQAVRASTRRDVEKALDDQEVFGVFIDIVMPSFDGIEVMEHLASREFKGPVIPISGKDRNQLAIAGRLAKARGLNVPTHLEKPVRLDEIEEVVKNLAAPARS